MKFLTSIVPLLSSLWWCLFWGDRTVIILLCFGKLKYKIITVVTEVSDILCSWCCFWFIIYCTFYDFIFKWRFLCLLLHSFYNHSVLCFEGGVWCLYSSVLSYINRQLLIFWFVFCFIIYYLFSILMFNGVFDVASSIIFIFVAVSISVL